MIFQYRESSDLWKQKRAKLPIWIHRAKIRWNMCKLLYCAPSRHDWFPGWRSMCAVFSYLMYDVFLPIAEGPEGENKDWEAMTTRHLEQVHKAWPGHMIFWMKCFILDMRQKRTLCHLFFRKGFNSFFSCSIQTLCKRSIRETLTVYEIVRIMWDLINEIDKKYWTNWKIIHSFYCKLRHSWRI